MRLLLDTHAFLWWADDDERLSPRARRLIASSKNDVAFSAVSAWEIGVKSSIGRLQLDEPAHRAIPRVVQANGFTVLPVTLGHALGIGALPWHHPDPFDRMLIAQAIAEDLRIVSRDDALRAYDVPVEW